MFHVTGAILFTMQSALLHPTAVVKTRMQVDNIGFGNMSGMTVFRHILRQDGIRGVFRGFGTSAIGSVHGRVFALTAFEMSKDMVMKHMPNSTLEKISLLLKDVILSEMGRLINNYVSSLLQLLQLFTDLLHPWRCGVTEAMQVSP